MLSSIRQWSTGCSQTIDVCLLQENCLQHRQGWSFDIVCLLISCDVCPAHEDGTQDDIPLDTEQEKDPNVASSISNCQEQEDIPVDIGQEKDLHNTQQEKIDYYNVEPKEKLLIPHDAGIMTLKQVLPVPVVLIANYDIVVDNVIMYKHFNDPPIGVIDINMNFKSVDVDNIIVDKHVNDPLIMCLQNFSFLGLFVWS